MDDPAAEHRRLMLSSCATIKKTERAMRGLARSVEAARNYQMYLLDENNSIKAAESFHASDQAAAADVAAAVHDACSDAFRGYELWRGIHRIDAGHDTVRDKPNFEEACRRHQALIVDLEEKLRDAFVLVARSRKLQTAYSRLRKQGSASIPT